MSEDVVVRSPGLFPRRRSGGVAAFGHASVRVPGDVVQQAAVQAERVAAASQTAGQILAQAQRDALQIRSAAQAEVARRADEVAARWQAAYDEREAAVTEALMRGVQVLVDSVLRSVLLADPGTQAQAAVGLSVRLLETQLRASLRCHPDDLEKVQASAAIGPTMTTADAAVPRGSVVYLSEIGEVRMDGRRFIDVLLADLRACFPWAGAPRPAAAVVPVAAPTSPPASSAQLVTGAAAGAATGTATASASPPSIPPESMARP